MSENEKQEILTVEKVKWHLDRIKYYADKGDDESAHSAEDSMYQHIVYAISTDTCENPKECCILAQQSYKMEFCRWCA